MKKICQSLVVLFFLSLFTEASSAPNELPPHWKKWLDEEVVYIIAPKEKEVFLSLKFEREREGFEKAFWLQRDPTPGTPANEFKDEHFRRVKYANEILARGGMKPGWKTDRGRIYIILGEPVDIQRFYESIANLNPCELWQYQGDTSRGLPPFFYLIFYQDQSGGEYRLYSPSFDGPQRLVQGSSQAASDRYKAYQQLQGASAELASASLSYIPGTSEDLTSQTSSLSSDLLVSSIHDLPVKKIQGGWADAFARNKEIITTDYSVNYVGCEHVLFIHQEGGRNYLHAQIEPHRLGLSQYEQKFYAPLKLNTILSDRSSLTIHQEEKSVDVEMSPDQFQKIQGRLSAITDVMPVVEGSFSLRLLLRNTESKEFSSVEENIVSPLSEGSSFSPILFLYNEKTVPPPTQTVPFCIHNHQLYPNTLRTFTLDEGLLFYIEFYNPAAELKTCNFSLQISQNEKVITSQTDEVGIQTYFLKRIAFQDYKPGFYKLKVAVVDSAGQEVMSQESEFNISALATVPRPWNYGKIYPPLGHPYFAIIRAYQNLNLGLNDRVIQELEKFYTPSQPNREIATVLARAHFARNEFSEAIKILDPLKEVQDLDIFLLLGKSHLQNNNFEKAIEYFTRSLTTGGEILEVLNLLGYSYYRNNDAQGALRFLERSLKINPEQTSIRELLEKVRSSRR